MNSTTKMNYLNEIEMIRFKDLQHFRTHRNRAHFYFDKIWQAKLIERNKAYEWLAEKLELTKIETHFRSMNDNKCIEAVYFCQQLLNDNRRLDLDFGAKPITPFYIL